MTALRPMLLMVCEPCARGDFDQEVVEGCSICNAVAGVPQPARTREEMVEAGLAAWREIGADEFWIQVGDVYGHDQAKYEAAVQARERREITAVLIAAGAIEEEAPDASV